MLAKAFKGQFENFDLQIISLIAHWARYTVDIKNLSVLELQKKSLNPSFG